MKYTKEERLELGRQIHELGLSNLKAGMMFGISEESARRYKLLYEHAQGLDCLVERSHKTIADRSSQASSEKDEIPSDSYDSMSKEELIEELMKSRIRETRLKKGYMVKGAGADKEYILLDIKNTK